MMRQSKIARVNNLSPDLKFEAELLDRRIPLTLECGCLFFFREENIRKKDISMISRVSISRRLAVATMLTVLSTSAAFAQVKNLSVRGSFDGHSIGVVQDGTLQASGGGAGNASHIGRFTYVLNATVNLANNTSTGVFLLAFNNGDVIHGSFTGVGGPPPPSGEGHIVENLTINGGTGRFEGATGSITLDQITDNSTLPAFASHSGTLTGTISTPK